MNAPAPSQQQPTSAWAMYRSIVGIGAFCAVLIVSVYQVTASRIQANQARFLAAAVAEVLPAAKSTVAVTVDDQGHLKAATHTEDLPVFLGYGEDKSLVGAVVTAQGMGYQDNIRVLYAYSFKRRAIVGFKVLESKETPGLGDRIQKDPQFLANFKALDTRLTADGTALQNPIVTVKHGEKTQPWQIDGITGATISSKAVATLLNKSANTWIPILERDARTFARDQNGTGH